MASKGINRILWSFSCFMLLIWPSDSQSDTLLQGQLLRDGKELYSENGTFTLGFFSPGSTSTKNRYVAIWYNPSADEDNSQKPVWIANRNTPIPDDSGILTIDGTDGNLKISHDGGYPDTIVLTWVRGVSNNTRAKLLESGNLVLREHNLDGSIKKVLWQSFDYPTDTFLPGMKLGIDLKSGLNRSLTSWRSDKLPASGSFTLGMDPNGTNQLVIWWRGDIFWTSGHWQYGIFQDFFEGSSIFNYTSNENEKYFNYRGSIGEKLTISKEGQLVIYGPYGNTTSVSCELELSEYSSENSSYGCVRQKLPECRIPYPSTNGDIYFEPHVGLWSSDGLLFNESDNMTLADCRAKCFNNCSCVAYASPNYDGTGCEIWSKRPRVTYSYSYDDGAADIYILESKENNWWIWAKWPIVVVGGALFILLLCSLYVIWKKCKAKGIRKEKQKMLLNELGGNAMASTTYGKAEAHKKDGNELHLFSLESISSATNNFSTANKLGQGGYGPVYKGKLHDGREIAIKRLSRSSGQGLTEFKNEATLIAKLQHTNLVRLLGFCIQNEEMILIYEYLPNKSLDFFLFVVTCLRSML